MENSSFQILVSNIVLNDQFHNTNEFLVTYPFQSQLCLTAPIESDITHKICDSKSCDVVFVIPTRAGFLRKDVFQEM